MTGKRIPKPGEEWGGPHGSTRKVVSVYPDAVTYLYDDNELLAMTLDVFVAHSTPPEPTVVDSTMLSQVADEDGLHTFWIGHSPTASHRLDLMSDGEFRVVKL